MKFIRKCELKVEVNPNSAGVTQSTLTIPEDITVEFEISRKFLSSSQNATFRIINLSPKTRNLLQKDPYVINENRWAVQFRAGYKDTPLALCFNGWVLSATSYRRGQTDMVTELTCTDGSLAQANSFSSITIASGTTARDAILKLARDLIRTSGQAIVGQFPQTYTRGRVLHGNTWSLILQESGNLATIDNGQLKVLNPYEVLSAQIPVINSDSGLLGVPRRTPTSLEFEMLFEPRLLIGQLIELKSTLNSLYNGLYKISGFQHRGTISPAVAEDCSTHVFLFFGKQEFEAVQGQVVQ